MAAPARTGWIITLATLVTVGSVLPVFLLGANGPAIMAELGMDAGGIGLAAGSYTAGLAVSSLALGGWLDRGSLVRAVGFSLVLVAAGGAATGLAPTPPLLGVGLCLSGIGSSAIQMSVGRIFSHSIASEHGVAFGWFQSAKPGAVALAGGFGLLAVLGLDWRWSYLIVVGSTATAGLTLAVWCFRTGSAPPSKTERPSLNGSVLLLASLMGVGFALTNISTTFIPDTVHAAEGTAGWASALLVIGGSVAAASRVYAGRLTDRTGWDEARLVGPGFIAAGVGCILISSLTHTGVLIGCLLVFALGWAFGGLLIAKGVRLNPTTSAAVIGQLLLGGAIGGSAAPPVFGSAAVRWGYDTAWLASGGLLLVAGSLCVRLGRKPSPKHGT